MFRNPFTFFAFYFILQLPFDNHCQSLDIYQPFERAFFQAVVLSQSGGIAFKFIDGLVGHYSQCSLHGILNVWFSNQIYHWRVSFVWSEKGEINMLDMIWLRLLQELLVVAVFNFC
eukprot:TRINITY_DN6379_c0_g1_i1.p5 TRINITY_DN6379_c0_g1~~TRINITY_DN6379_c0_g1_i1.p5  ORF type:complete len:116 (-),score=6.96 TRINITY_DN6379_c0_g1_i1:301-648(-)